MGLFGTSGIRGPVTEEMVSLAFRVGIAVGRTYGAVVVGHDTRTSSDVMKHAVLAGLLAVGARADDAGTVPTPTLARAARGYEAGLMITASHNPPEDNGIKLWNPDGSAFGLQQQQQIEEIVNGDSRPLAAWREMKSGGILNGVAEQHIARIRQDFPDDLKIRVVVDAGCGAAALLTPNLLREMGCEVLALDCYPSGFFPRVIEPVEANLGTLMKIVRESGAALGVAHDGDADRMMAVDDRGRFIPGDSLFILLARARGAREVVTTVDASLVVEEAGFAVRRTRVGDSFVSAELKENGGDFGGEPSGAWIFPGVSYCPDGLYAAAQLAAIAGRQRISELVDSIPAYPLRRGSVNHHGVDLSRLETGLRGLQPSSVCKTDGIKLVFTDGWLLVRASGTEPKIRLTAEAREETRLNEIYAAGLTVLQDCAVAGRQNQ